MQFIGRFARTQANLGDASVVANIVDDDINEALEDLYTQDSDWNNILKNVSDEKIGREMEFQKLAQGFTGTEEIPQKPNQTENQYVHVLHRRKLAGIGRIGRRYLTDEYSRCIVNKQEKILLITRAAYKQCGLDNQS